MLDYLFLAGKFDRYSGPNNHLLDLGNYLYTKSGKSLVLVTHSGFAEPDFLKEIRFPTAKTLQRSARIISNVRVIRGVIRNYSPRRIFVNCDANLAFQAFFATQRRLLVGYNVFLIGANLTLDRYLVKSAYFSLQDRIGPRLLVDRIIAHTDFHREAYMRIGIQRDQITVIPHCVDSDRLYRALGCKSKIEKNEVPTVIFARSLTRDKGILELLNAYQYVAKKMDARLLIIGSGPLERRVEEIKRRIEMTNSKARITHVKRVSLPELACLTYRADVVAIPSHGETFGLIALDAMALRKTVLATCFGGISEIITNGRDGILIDPFDKHQFQSSLEELLSNSSERARLGSAAYQTVKNKYDVSVVAPRFVEFLEK